MKQQRPDLAKTEFVCRAAHWEDSDYVVTIRPEWEKAWKDVPIGITYSERDARLIASWLQSNIKYIFKIFRNMQNEKTEK